MYFVYIEPIYGIVEQVLHFTNDDISNFMTHHFRQSSLNQNNICKVINLPDDQIPEDVKNNYKSHPHSYVFDISTNTFKKRPVLHIVGIEDNQKIKIKSAVDITIVYYDPDNVGFNKKFEYVKIKDRAGLIKLPDSITLDDDGKYTLTIKSQYPGVSTLRVKDNLHICYYEYRGINIKWIV